MKMLKIMRERTLNRLLEESYIRGQRADAKKIEVPLTVSGDLQLTADAFFIEAEVTVGRDLILYSKSKISGKECPRLSKG
jgi:hypothetical protein